jgi:two-component sensor histidine kinase/CheY-like chemotaxis protein
MQKLINGGKAPVHPNGADSDERLADDSSPPSDCRTRSAASVIADELINILIVDDEPKNLTVLETVLDDPGYRLVRAGSADEALLALLAEEFALLILDIRMPGVTGLELAQLIKGRKKTSQIPIIFLTAYYNEDQHVLKGYISGGVDYLQKPINPTIIRSKVAVFAELHRKQREVERSNRALSAEVESRREAEDRLRALNVNLEARVVERTDEIKTLLNEVNHRSKNIFSLVTAIARQTAFGEPKEFIQRFARRIEALATHHNLLVSSKWQSIELSTLVHAQLSHFEDLVGKRIFVAGPEFRVTASAVPAIGMAVHELATNAVKHGALSNENGHVRISWEIAAHGNESRFLMCWIESGGPPAKVPSRRGFGSKVIKNMVELSVDGEVRLQFESSGLAWSLSCKTPNICDDGIARSNDEKYVDQ